MHPASMLTELASNIPSHMHGELHSGGCCIFELTRRSIAFLNDTPDLVGDTFAFLGSKKRDWLAGRFVAVCWDMPEFMAKEKEVVEKDALKFRMVV